MAFSRRLGVIGIVGASWLVAVGCGSDDDKKTNTDAGAGEAGDSGGGKSSVGGSSSNAGKGGTSTGGKGGGGAGGKNAGGTGGTTAGTGGSANNAGEAGQGGSPLGEVGGAGGAPESSSAGAGGDAAGAGGAGVGPAAPLLACANQCEIDDDCLVDGAIVQMTCDPTSKRCVDTSVITCQTVDDCTPSASFWTFAPCTSVDDCDGGYECIDWKGSGYCAYTPDPDCFPGDLTVTLGRFGLADSPVEVCYTPQPCLAGACGQPGCELTGCEAGTGDTCSATTHECECTTGGDECSVTGVCGADHHCTECKIDDDCPAGNTGKDKCVEGKCGCSGAAACPDPTANATPVCE
jgi:hypothetical protein